MTTANGSDRLEHLIGLVVRTSRFGAGKYQFLARFPSENFEIRKLAEGNDSDTASLLCQALDEMKRADDIANDPYRQYMRHRYTLPLYRTLEKLEAIKEQGNERVEHAQDVPKRREMLTADLLFPRA